MKNIALKEDFTKLLNEVGTQPVDKLDTSKPPQQKRVLKTWKGRKLLPIPDRRKKFLEYLSDSNGMLSPAVRKMKDDGLSISLEWITKHRKKNKNFDDALNLAQSNLNNYVENKLFEKITEGNVTAICFFLKSMNSKYKNTMDLDIKTITTLTDEQKNNILAEIKNT